MRGLREYRKSKKIFNWVAKHGGNRGIAFLQETHSTVDIETEWSQRYKGDIIMSHGTSNSKGVAILFGEQLDYSIVKKIIDQNGRFILVLCLLQGNSFLLINSYAPNDEKNQVSLLLEICEVIYNLDCPVDTSFIWGGDFNFIFDIELEASGGNPKLKTRSIEAIREIMLDLDLCDIWRVRNPDAKKFTWSGKAQGRSSSPNITIYRRLDYFLISDELQSYAEQVDIIPAPSTDHSAVTLRIKSLPGVKNGPSFWKFNNSLINDNNYIRETKNVINNCKVKMNSEGIKNPQLRWDLLKYEIRKSTITFSKARAKTFRNEYRDIEEKIKEIESFNGWELDPVKTAEHDCLKKSLEEKSNYITEGIILRSKVSWYEQGEKNTKYFLSLEKRNKAKTHLRKLLTENSHEITEPKEILNNIEHFYSELYSRKNIKTHEDCSAFMTRIDSPTLTAEEKATCEGYLTANECFNALKGLGSSKTPGMDGLTKEFYLAFWDVLNAELIKSLNSAFDSGTLSTSQQQVVITLLEKPGKDKRLLSSWRPISLINVDTKICSKVLSNRMSKVLTKLFDPDQAAFIKGRNIEDSIRLIDDIMDFTMKNDESLILFAADFEKAFDSIEHNFILASLTHFGFGEDFIKWISVLLRGNRACVLNNGFATNLFNIARGTKQGDPISPYLFILVIEVLASLVRQNRQIEGIWIGEKHKKLELFADDSTFFLKDIASLNAVLKSIQEFYLFSSLKINTIKSEAGWIGSSKLDAQPTNDDGIKWINLNESGINILGISFSYNDTFFREQNLDRIFESFKTVLNIWKMRSLTLFGKSTIIKSLALPKLLYVCSKIFVPDHFISKVKNVITDFIWNGKKPKIKYDTLIGNCDNGGINLPDFESQIKANRVKWALNLLDENYVKSWKSFPMQHLASIGGTKAIGTNFDKERIPKVLSHFYKSVLVSWAEYCNEEVVTPEHIVNQVLWNNKNIKVNNKSVFFPQLASSGIFRVKDLYNERNEINWETAHAMGVEPGHFIFWASITSAIPQSWKVLMKDVEVFENHDPSNPGRNGTASKITSKDIYLSFVQSKFKKPTAQSHILKRVDSQIDWESVYRRIYNMCIDPYTRCFQYKILNNCLYLNRDLFRFKIIESPICSFCSNYSETIDHVFVHCEHSKSLYRDIRIWTKSSGIVLPDLNISNIILGIDSEKNGAIINLILIVFKLIIYKSRSSGQMPSVQLFINQLGFYEKIERNIARKRDKLACHFKKWTNLLSIL